MPTGEGQALPKIGNVFSGMLGEDEEVRHESIVGFKLASQNAKLAKKVNDQRLNLYVTSSKGLTSRTMFAEL